MEKVDELDAIVGALAVALFKQAQALETLDATAPQPLAMFLGVDVGIPAWTAEQNAVADAFPTARRQLSYVVVSLDQKQTSDGDMLTILHLGTFTGKEIGPAKLNDEDDGLLDDEELLEVSELELDDEEDVAR